MNKQEAIELLRDVAQRVFYRTGRRSVHIDKIVELVNQIDEPQKVVVPKFVADWVDNSREYSFDFDEWLDYENQPLKVYNWLNPENKRQAELNVLALVTLIVNGANAVEVEQEKLYTVEIDGVSSGKLFKNIRTNEYLFHSGNGFNGYTDKLTETEIKQKDERLWQFAKEVE